MAGTVKANVVQLGDSATATQNLVIKTNVNGTFTIARGNDGSTSQDILTIDANGRIAMPQNVLTFRAYRNAALTVASNTWTKVPMDTEVFDTASWHDTSTGRFTPQVAGYYWFCGAVAFTSTPTNETCAIFKNGVNEVAGAQGGAYRTLVSGIVYMNGTTDYVEFWGYSGNASPALQAGTGTYFMGNPIQRA